MNINKFTQKSMQAVQDCEKLAYQYGNQEIDQEHLIVALLHQEDSLFAKLITKMDIQPGCSDIGKESEGIRRKRAALRQQCAE